MTTFGAKNYNLKSQFSFYKSRVPLDEAWEYGSCEFLDSNTRVKCKFCAFVVSEGINIMKYHLARIIYKDVTFCDYFPLEVTGKMQANLDAIKEHNDKRAKIKHEITRKGGSQTQT